jgi:2-polyprenyl-3-methyl-5-hydroxy-6-metoxy-1,4-benzoquinol methylase
MRWHSTSDDWEELGQLDPFWAVISDESYRRENLSERELARFLETGEEQVAGIWRTCRFLFGEAFAPARVLDFGCGVGRMTLPLARRADSVVAVDIADSMLGHARQLLARHGVSNVQLVKADDTLSALRGPFDLVHSAIVLQHIPVGAGLGLIERLVELAGDRGAVVLHVLYENPRRRALPVRIAARALRPFRSLRGRLPEIQMNPYPFNEVLRLLQQGGVRRFHADLTDHAGHLGATLFFRKDAHGPPV